MIRELQEKKEKLLKANHVPDDAYNALQQQQGYDLTPYKGKQVQLYTYEITNYTGYDQGIVADLLVSNGRVIGADLCNTSAKDGFMLGLEKRK